MSLAILAGIAGFLLGVVLTALAAWYLTARRHGSAREKAKEFTQYMILSDNAILWYMCTGYLGLAAFSIYKNYTGALPWLTGGLALAFGGWATIQAFLIKKSEKQNTKGGITYDTAMREQDRLTTTEERTNLHI